MTLYFFFLLKNSLLLSQIPSINESPLFSLLLFSQLAFLLHALFSRWQLVLSFSFSKLLYSTSISLRDFLSICSCPASQLDCHWQCLFPSQSCCTAPQSPCGIFSQLAVVLPLNCTALFSHWQLVLSFSFSKLLYSTSISLWDFLSIGSCTASGSAFEILKLWALLHMGRRIRSNSLSPLRNPVNPVESRVKHWKSLRSQKRRRSNFPKIRFRGIEQREEDKNSKSRS